MQLPTYGGVFFRSIYSKPVFALDSRSVPNQKANLKLELVFLYSCAQFKVEPLLPACESKQRAAEREPEDLSVHIFDLEEFAPCPRIKWPTQMSCVLVPNSRKMCQTRDSPSAIIFKACMYPAIPCLSLFLPCLLVVQPTQNVGFGCQTVVQGPKCVERYIHFRMILRLLCIGTEWCLFCRRLGTGCRCKVGVPC